MTLCEMQGQWYSATASTDPTAFQHWLEIKYGIHTVLFRARDNITDYPVTSYRWEVEYINDEEKATLFKLEWS